MKLNSVQAALLAIPLLTAAPANAQDKAPLKINFGYTTADHVNLYVAQDLGLFQKAGLEPQFFTFQSGAPLLAALKSESVDVVLAGLGFAFALGQNIPLKMIYWNTNDALGEGLVVDSGSDVKSYQDIAKAKKIGAASGTCAQVALYLMAKKVGVDYGKLDIVNIPAPLFRNSFMSHSIDVGIAWSPYSAMLDAQGYRVVNWDTDYTPLGGVCPRTTAVRPAFLKNHPEVGARLLEVDRMAACVAIFAGGRQRSCGQLRAGHPGSVRNEEHTRAGAPERNQGFDRQLVSQRVRSIARQLGESAIVHASFFVT